MGRESAFSLLGLPERFSLSDEEIDRAWRERIALVHPDRFAALGDAAKRVAEQQKLEAAAAERKAKEAAEAAAAEAAAEAEAAEGEEAAE